MKTSFAVAACAVLSLAVAACGDDDDDAATGDSTELTTPDLAGTAAADSAAADETVADETVADTAPTASDGAGEATEAAADITEEQAADCAAFEELYQSLPAIDAPDVGEELTDDYKDEARSAIEQLEDLDLQSDEGRAARESLVDDMNELLDADTMTEELQTLGASDEIVTFGQICASSLGG